MKFEWEKLYENKHHFTMRAKVIGGWLINNTTIDYFVEMCAQSESMVFVSDPNHDWEVENDR